VAYVVVCLVCVLASSLTLLSGFGLGTLLLPAFALFFPVELAVSATAVVHLANNLFKLALVGRHARRDVVIRFGVPAVVMAGAGAWVLSRLTRLPVLAEYTLGGRACAVTPIKLVVASLILVFAAWDLSPAAERLGFERRFVPLGGAISGFFGGLSGHQGALRSAFLIHAGLGKEGFIGTGVVCAVLVDLSRLGVYGTSLVSEPIAVLGRRDGYPLVLAAVGAAFAGALLGVRLLGRMALPGLRLVVGVLLVLIALAMGTGLV
jgi:hypothetical protein